MEGFRSTRRRGRVGISRTSATITCVCSSAWIQLTCERATWSATWRLAVWLLARRCCEPSLSGGGPVPRVAAARLARARSLPWSRLGRHRFAGRPKAAYWYLKRAFAPVALLAVDEGLNGLWFHALNDTCEPIETEIRITLYREGRPHGRPRIGAADDPRTRFALRPRRRACSTDFWT